MQVSAEQVIMSHSPLRVFPQFHHKHVLVSGQGPVVEIAKMYPLPTNSDFALCHSENVCDITKGPFMLSSYLLCVVARYHVSC